jgi:hypothetical protein
LAFTLLPLNAGQFQHPSTGEKIVVASPREAWLEKL